MGLGGLRRSFVHTLCTKDHLKGTGMKERTPGQGYVQLDFAMRNVSKYRTQQVRLRCEITGSPIPAYYWFKNQTPLEDGSERGRISIRHTTWGSSVFEKRCQELKVKLQRRGYPGSLIDAAMRKVSNQPRTSTLQYSRRNQQSKADRVPFIVRHNPNNPSLSLWLKQFLPVLHTSARMRKAAPVPPIVGERNCFSLRNLLMPSALPPLPDPQTQGANKGCHPCNKYTLCLKTSSRVDLEVGQREEGRLQWLHVQETCVFILPLDKEGRGVTGKLSSARHKAGGLGRHICLGPGGEVRGDTPVWAQGRESGRHTCLGPGGEVRGNTPVWAQGRGSGRHTCLGPGERFGETHLSGPRGEVRGNTPVWAQGRGSGRHTCLGPGERFGETHLSGPRGEVRGDTPVWAQGRGSFDHR
ncbi:hypothetical protein ACOMHN_003167 [Nucella lapillus]